MINTKIFKFGEEIKSSKVRIFEEEIELLDFNIDDDLDADAWYIIGSSTKNEFMDKAKQSGIYPSALLYSDDPQEELSNDEMSYFDSLVDSQMFAKFEIVLNKCISETVTLTAEINSLLVEISANETIMEFPIESNPSSAKELFANIAQLVVGYGEAAADKLSDMGAAGIKYLIGGNEVLNLNYASALRGESAIEDFIKSEAIEFSLNDSIAIQILIESVDEVLVLAKKDGKYIEFATEITYLDQTIENISKKRKTMKIINF
mgnify:CR=1 FL=1